MAVPPRPGQECGSHEFWAHVAAAASVGVLTGSGSRAARARCRDEAATGREGEMAVRCQGRLPDERSSSGLRIGCVDRPLRGEGPLVCGTCLAAGNVGGQSRELIEKARGSEPQ